jgi:hypothetical protein
MRRGRDDHCRGRTSRRGRGSDGGGPSHRGRGHVTTARGLD